MEGKSKIVIFAKIYCCLVVFGLIVGLISYGLNYLFLPTNKKPHLCPCCSFEYQENAKPAYCPNCGKKINNVCSNCGRSFENDKKIPEYCPDCGTKQLDSKEK